jgi:hypothetical protein
VTVDLGGNHPSPPALEDVNADGILETALRDDRYFYLLTGFGSLMDDWPVALSGRMRALEREGSSPPPIIVDLDNDDAMDIVYHAGRNLYAFDRRAHALAGFPLLAEGTTAGSPAVSNGSGGEGYLFAAGSFDLIAAVGAWDAEPLRTRSALRRYATEAPMSFDRGWHMYRRDRGGSGRQERSSLDLPVEEAVDERSFKIYPNPVLGNSFRVRIDCSRPARIRLEFLTIEGERVASIDARHDWPDGSRIPFEEEVAAAAFASGIYICRMEIDGADWSWRGFKKFAVTR